MKQQDLLNTYLLYLLLGYRHDDFLWTMTVFPRLLAAALKEGLSPAQRQP